MFGCMKCRSARRFAMISRARGASKDLGGGAMSASGEQTASEYLSGGMIDFHTHLFDEECPHWSILRRSA